MFDIDIRSVVWAFPLWKEHIPWIESTLSLPLSWATYNLVNLTGLTSLNCKMRKLFHKTLVRMKFREITDTTGLFSSSPDKEGLLSVWVAGTSGL